MKELFLHFALYISFLFTIALPPEIWKNYQTKLYASGTRGSWMLRIIGYSIFGIYSMCIHEYATSSVQLFSLLLSIIIISQSFMYPSSRTT